jgi:squalene-hopene/tetraprenyl-beta-curcumene cyclase
MSLIGAGQPQHEVVTQGIAFLVDSVRPDGSWPIDTNLTTWVSTLSINALGENTPEPAKLRDWLLRQQYRVTHPYTMALPGGWAWTDLSGGVPDADDTPSALLALGQLDDGSDMVLSAARGGVNWLLNLQNRDGGIPTFCKGWGTLPFDRSSNDLTAHTVRAWHAWYPRLDHAYQRRIDLATRKALRFLQDRQNPDGSWAPLWFGNQYAKDVSNLTYGTSRVLKLLEYPSLAAEHPQWQDALARGQSWLLGSQNDDGGWGGRSGTPSSLEETALALEGLALQPERNLPGRAQAIPRGIEYLDRTTEQGREFPASPIGFYFANLWYFEKLYPLVFTVAALKKVRAFVDFQTSGIS